MTVEELNKHIRSGSMSGIYFFYGEEDYLAEKKLDAIKKKIITAGTEAFNYFKFDGKNVSAAEILAAVDQFPQMSEMKLIVVKDTGILGNAVLTDFKLIKAAAERIPSDTCLVITEREYDKKKLKNIDFIEQNGGIVHFEYLPQNKLEIWLVDMFAKEGLKLCERDARYMIRLCGQSLRRLCGESDKLISYASGRAEITTEDIDAVVEKTVEYRTYDMLDNVVAGRGEKAREQLKYLFETGEKPHNILGLIMTRLSELLMCKLLKEDGLSADEIADYFDFKRPSFVVKKTIDESRRFDEKYLKKMIDRGLYYDLESKQGRLKEWPAVEMYLAELTR